MGLITSVLYGFGAVAATLAAAATATKLYRLTNRPGFDVRNKHVFITGGSAGLGLALARLCYTRGARVTIVARNIAQLNQAKADIIGPNATEAQASRVQVRV